MATEPQRRTQIYRPPRSQRRGTSTQGLGSTGQPQGNANQRALIKAYAAQKKKKRKGRPSTTFREESGHHALGQKGRGFEIQESSRGQLGGRHGPLGGLRRR